MGAVLDSSLAPPVFGPGERSPQPRFGHICPVNKILNGKVGPKTIHICLSDSKAENGEEWMLAFTLANRDSKCHSVGRVDGPLERSMLLELALAALDELVKMAHMNLSLWNLSMDGGDESLNYEEYRQVFSHCTGMKQAGFAFEATRETGMVMINSSALVESLFDVVCLADMFPGMIARATTTNVISRGMDGTINGALQLHKLIEKCTLGASKMLPKIKKARQIRATMAANAQNQHSGTTLVADSPVAQGRWTSINDFFGDTVSSKPQKYDILNVVHEDSGLEKHLIAQLAGFGVVCSYY